MKPKDPTKNMIQESMRHTSADFTEELMHKIEAQPAAAPVKIGLWQQFLFGMSLVALLLFACWGWGRHLHVAVGSPHFQVPSLPSLLIVVLFAILAVYRYILFKKLSVPFQEEH